MIVRTQSEIAEQLGVSRSTVAAVLNRKSRIKLSDQTRRRVLDTATRLGYRPHRHAQVMRRGKSGLIGVVQYPTLLQTANERLFHLAQVIHDAGYQVLSSDPLWFRGDVAGVCNTMLDARVEGLVFTSEMTLAQAEQFGQAGIPLVSLSYRFPNFPLVRADVQQGMFDLTQHALKVGHQRLALLVQWSPDRTDENIYASSLGRVRGFREAIETADGRVIIASSEDAAPAWDGDSICGEILCERGQDGYFAPNLPGFQAMERLLRRSTLPDVVVCANDDWAVGAMNACLRAGKRVPQDIAITGFDNTSLGALCPSPLTTVAQPVEAVAKKAVELLLRMIRGEKLSTSEELIKLPCRVVVRESCGGVLPPRPA